VLQIAQQPHRLAPVLRDLVRHVTQARVAYRDFGKCPVARRLDDRPAGGGHDLIGALLRPFVGDQLRRTRAPDELANDRRRLIVGSYFLLLDRCCLHR